LSSLVSVRRTVTPCTLLDTLDLRLEIALEGSILLDPKLFVLRFGQLLGHLRRNRSRISEHVVLVELQKRIEPVNLTGLDFLYQVI
jgi:hypothetical protein